MTYFLSFEPALEVGIKKDTIALYLYINIYIQKSVAGERGLFYTPFELTLLVLEIRINSMKNHQLNYDNIEPKLHKLFIGSAPNNFML